jgi:uncharacterized membrane protein YeaQ/YmgE (transglycosylase-associated protein family)
VVLYIVGLLVIGLVVGAIARLLVRSPMRLGCIGTILLGIIGSYVGGTLGALLYHDTFDIRRASTLIGSIAGTVAILVVWRLIDGRGRLRRY